MPYTSQSVKNVGIGNLVGIDKAGVHTCTWQHTPRLPAQPIVTTATFTVDGQNKLTTISGTPIATYRNACNNGSVASECIVARRYDAEGECPLTYSNGSLLFTRTASTDTDVKTGVFEYGPMVASIGLVAVLIVVIAVGLALAKKTVKATTEDTCEDDMIYYWEDANGKLRWSIKHNRADGSVYYK